MQIKYTLYIIGILILFSACKNSGVTDKKNTQNNTQKSITETDYDISWIDGAWVDSTKFSFKKLKYHEIWKTVSDNFIGGIKFSSKEGKSNENTTIGITVSENKLYYSYKVKNEQVTYYSDSTAEQYVRFINETDKFPQTIEYKRIKDTLIISLSGMAGGVFRNPIYKTLKY